MGKLINAQKINLERSSDLIQVLIIVKLYIKSCYAQTK